MNELIQLFITNGGGHFSFTKETRLPWLLYLLLTPEEHDRLRFLGFGFSVTKIQSFSHNEIRLRKRFPWPINLLDKEAIPVYKEIVTVNMFPVKQKPTLEIL